MASRQGVIATDTHSQGLRRLIGKKKLAVGASTTDNGSTLPTVMLGREGEREREKEGEGGGGIKHHLQCVKAKNIASHIQTLVLSPGHSHVFNITWEWPGDEAIILYRRSGNFRVKKLSYDKFSCKKIFVGTTPYRISVNSAC